MAEVQTTEEKAVYRRVIVISKERDGYNGLVIPRNLFTHRGGHNKDGLYILSGHGVEFDADQHTLFDIQHDRRITVKFAVDKKTGKELPPSPEEGPVRRISPDEIVRSLGGGTDAEKQAVELADLKKKLNDPEELRKLLAAAAKPQKTQAAE